MPPKNRFGEWLPEIAAWRRDIHAHPEILFDTHRTAALVAERLREWGCDEVVEGIGRTGVVGVIRGRETGSGRVVGLRADMDALPITEATGAPWASQVPGAMHACGHDGHTAMLLGAARYLCETRAFDGTVLVIFQPAEEGGGGGREMVADGMMERWGVSEVYGMHNFEIVVEGKGGHAAKPQETVDPTVTAAHVVLALQSIVSRNADPVGQLVVSVTAIESSSKAFNVIPVRVSLRGTVRTMSRTMREMAEARIKAVAESTCSAYGAGARVAYHRGYPSMVNHERETEYAREVARDVSGACEEAPLVMGGEDFSYMLEARPGAYILLGNGNTAEVHNPDYDFNDEAIPAGCSWLVGMAEARLPLAQ
jgi:metal-dependent amidase/aminoacylase/carboxypeptidase family protein